MLRFFLLGISLCAALTAPSIFPELFKPVNFALDDWRVRFAIRPRAESRIVIVDVDERSLAEQGAWPWSRDKIARLLQILLTDYGVTSIAVDMVFPEARPNDSMLALQLQRPQVTGAVVFDLERRNLPALHLPLPPAPPLQTVANAPLVFGMPVVSNHAGLMPASAGHITPIFDSDGVVRRLPPLICDSGSCRPSLSLAAYARLVDGVHMRMQPGRGLLAPAWELTFTEHSGAVLVTLPVTAEGLLILPYRHIKKDWISVSATDVLNHKPDPALLKGVMVLVGGTALGLSDTIATPLSALTAGLEPHVELLSALLDDDFPVMPEWGWALDILLLLPFAILLAWALNRYAHPLQRAAIFPVWLMLTWGCSAVFSIVALHTGNMLLPLSPLLLFPPFAVLLTVLVELYRTGRERAGILTLLSVYLPQQVANRLVTFGRGDAKINSSVDASRREITVLFADISGFAGLSEDQPPEIVARLMQRVFTEMAEAVVAHGGTIDKFIGDAIMAFWNAPQDDPDHASHALAAAHDILRRMMAVSPFCAELGLPPIRIGIGIETGEALVGNFGSVHRRTFTALGDPVVLASRLEALTKTHQQPILIGEACAVALGFKGLRALGPVKIRGRIHPITLYVPNE